MKRSTARTTGILAVSILIAGFAVAPVAFAADNVTFCHQKGNGGYVSSTTTDPSSILTQGHGSHEGDIIPAFNYGVGKSFPGLNLGGDGQAWLDRSCAPPPKLTLVKLVVGSDEPASSWTLSAAGTSISGAAGSAGATGEVLAGTYALSESGPTGYTSAGWLCSNATGSSQSVTIGKAEVDPVTCTITNTLDPVSPVLAQLTLVKVVVGSDEPASAWTLDATGGPTPFAEGPSGVSHGVAAGNYSLFESADPGGYSSPGWACSNAAGFVQSVTIGAVDVTCTITNTLDPVVPALVQLTLVKEVVNAFGESADATAWTLRAEGATSFEGRSGGASATHAVEPGNYTLSEFGGPSGYTASDWYCSNDDVGPAITISSNGGAVTCTITNTFVPTTHMVDLTLVKVVEGGNEPASSWTLDATDGQTAFAEGPSGVSHGVVAGTYALSESGPSGYTGSDWVCPGASVSGDRGSQTVTIGSDVEAVTCTITNTFVPTQPVVPGDTPVQPRITLKAEVVNDAGGSAQVSDFTLTGSSIEVTNEQSVQHSSAMVASAATTSFSGVTGDAAITNAVVPVGTYFLSESALPSGYSASAWTCTGGQLNGSAITVTFGNAVECLITNTYSSTVVDSAGVPTAHPASPPAAVLGVEETAPGAEAPTATAPTVTTLAFTGAEPVPLSLLALLALVLGVALTVAGRRQGGQQQRG